MEISREHIITQDRAAGVNIQTRTISRYGVVFDSDSLPLMVENESGERFTIIERITRDSVKDADMEDMICARNHNFDKILGRRSNGTMKIEVDNDGIKYTTQVCKTTYGDDTLENVRRNDIEGSSFVFSMDLREGYEIQEHADGMLIAIPKKITKIYEMGPVTSPAYLGTIEGRNAELSKAVMRYVETKKERAAIEQPTQKEETPKAQERAMDIMDMVDIVSSAFYERFDLTDDSWYYIQSIAVDNTLVAKEYPSRKLYRLSFSINEENEVEFDDKDQWTQVQKEYIEVTSARAFYDSLNDEKMKRDKAGEEEKEGLVYPDVTLRKAKAKVMKQKNKRV